MSTPVTPPPAAPSAVKDHAQRHFDQWARSYDRSLLNEVVFFPSIRACQEEILKWKAERGGSRPYRLLDIGCGTGTPVSLMARDPDARLLIGLDYSPEMVRRAAAKFAGLPCADRAAAVNADSEHLPLADGSIDVITCCNSFHHYPRQPQAVREFRRVLAPGGVVILIDGFRDNLLGWLIFDVGVASVERQVHHASWHEARHMFEGAGLGRIAQRKLNVLAPLLVTTGRCDR